MCKKYEVGFRSERIEVIDILPDGMHMLSCDCGSVFNRMITESGIPRMCKRCYVSPAVAHTYEETTRGYTPQEIDMIREFEKKKKVKTIITFGSSQLAEYAINPSSIMLVLEMPENEARELVREEFDNKYCTSYPYKPYAENFKQSYDMVEITIEELRKLKMDV